MSLHLFKSSLISLDSALQFLVLYSLFSFFPKYFNVFDAFVNGTVSLISFLVVHCQYMVFCLVILCPATLLNQFILVSVCVYVYVCAHVCVNSLGFSTYRILSLNENNFTSLFPIWCLFFSVFTFYIDFLNIFYVGLKHIQHDFKEIYVKRCIHYFWHLG